MKNFLKTFTVTIPAGEKESSLAAGGTAITVYDTNSPFKIYDDNGSLYEIDRACRIESEGGPGFSRLTLVRPEGSTEKITVKLAVGQGVRLIDGRLQYTSETVNAPVFNIAAVNPLPSPPITGRFLPQYTPKHTLTGIKYFEADKTAAPRIVAASASNLNLVARADLAVTKRVVKLLSGGPVNLGVSYKETGYPGHVAALAAVGDTITIEGGQWLYGTATADATLSVYEVHAGESVPLINFEADSDITGAGWPDPTLEGYASWSMTNGGVVDEVYGIGNIDGTDLCSIPGSTFRDNRYTGNVPCYPSGYPSKASSVSANIISFKGVTLTEAATYGQAHESANNPAPNTSYLRFSLAALSAGRTIATHDGAHFTLPIGSAGGTHFSRFFRIAFPHDGSPAYFEQAANYLGGPITSWVRNS